MTNPLNYEDFLADNALFLALFEYDQQQSMFAFLREWIKTHFWLSVMYH